MMNNRFLIKFALTNLKNNAKMIIPFTLTSTLSVMMFYNAQYLLYNNATGFGSFALIIFLLGVLLGIFCMFFLFYTNSFLFKRRKKEFGLYNVLGLEKKHIVYIVLLETFFIAVFSIIVGLSIGILFSRLMTTILYHLIQFDLKYVFTMNFQALFNTVVLFTIIFIIITISNSISIYRSKTIELIKANQIGEQISVRSLFFSIVGIGTLICGYHLALSIDDIIASIYEFFIAALLVSFGTYFVFSSISIVFLYLLKKNRKIYYQVENMIAISGLIHRLKRNAAGLTNITILSTGIILVISTTLAMYLSIEEMLDYRYGFDASIEIQSSEMQGEYLDNLSYYLHELIDDISNYQVAESAIFLMDTSLEETSYTAQEELKYDESLVIQVMTLEIQNEYMQLIEGLTDDQVICSGSSLGVDEISLFGEEYQIVAHLDNFDSNLGLFNFSVGATALIFNQESFNVLVERGNISEDVHLQVQFDVSDESSNAGHVLANLLHQDDRVVSYEYSYDHAAEFHAIYGGLYFLGLFLGTLFLFAILLVLYYKQVIEGYDDHQNYLILKKIGLSKDQVKKSIRRQVSMVFFLPIGIAIIHMVFAYRALTLILRLLNLTNTNIFIVSIICVVAGYFVLYVVMYLFTSRVYYRIVNVE